MATSQNGYPVRTSETCKVWRIPVGSGAKRHIVLAPGAPGFVLVHLATWFDDEIEPLNQGQWDEWGFAPRAIRGSTTVSNHASGTAEDLNATEHPMGVRNTFTAEQQQRIRRKLRRYRGVIRWGGDYVSRPDDMHFEINASRAKVRAVAAVLRATRRGRRIRKANP